MTRTLLLRIASIISLVFAVGHIIGGFKLWSPMGNNPVLESMKNVRFDIMGADRGYLDLYLGFGYIIAVYQLMQSIIIWQLASLGSNFSGVRSIIAVITLAVAASGIVASIYLFPVPVIFSAILCACLVAAMAVAK